MDKTVASQTWNVLAKAIDEIYDRNASQLSFEELYRNAYNLVLHKHGTLLYDGVTEKLNSHLTETAERLSNVSDTSLLIELSTTWTEHQVRFFYLHCRYLYLFCQEEKKNKQLGSAMHDVVVFFFPPSH